MRGMGANPDADRRMMMSGAVAPASAKFNFWSSMGDLGSLVLRSRARGLKSRLCAALGLVILGKWTGVIGPLFIQRAIDRLNHGRATPDAAFTAFAGLVIGWVILRFIAGVAPYLRDFDLHASVAESPGPVGNGNLRSLPVALDRLPPGQAKPEPSRGS